jgi:putative ABC transport system permease protein
MFELSKAIRDWKRSFQKEATFEDGFIADLELHLRDAVEELKREGIAEEEAFREAAARVGTAESLAAEYGKVREYRLDLSSPWRPARFVPALPWHYLKVALRKIRRQMSYSVINVAGLAVGMACFLLILTFIQFEASYDRFHEKSGRIYRLAVLGDSPAKAEYSLSTPEILSRALVNRIPEIERAGIVQRSRNAILQTERNHVRENGLFADPNFFRLFSFELLVGDRAEALAAPRSIILSDRLAARLFGGEDPVGKILKYGGGLLACDLNVTGIMKPPPKNSHLEFDYLISVATLAANAELAEWFNDWDVSAFWTYVELRDRQSPRSVEPKIEALFREGDGTKEPKKEKIYLQRITDIHLKSRVAGETATNNRIKSVYLLGSIALIILLVAGINAMNLSTARSSTRTKEICIRKVVGGSRPQLIRQFLGESYILTGVAMVLALMLFVSLFPLFTDFLGAGLALAEVDKFPLAVTVLGTLLFVGAFSGIYPAVVLSKFQPFSLFKKSPGPRPKGAGVRNLLVVVQFAAAVVLLIGTLVIAKQMNYIQKTKLGFEKDHVVMLSLEDEEAKSAAKVMKARLEAYHKVLGVTVSDSSPLSIGSSVGGSSVQNENGETVKIDFSLAHVDDDFVRVYGLKIAEGRNFSPEFSGDAGSILVNQALVRKIGWTNPIGKKLMKYAVIGVVEDFHFDTLHKEIEPAAFFRREAGWGKTLLGIRVQPGDPEGTLAEIKNACAQVTASRAMDFYFLDEAFDKQYRRERRLAAMIGYLEAIAILLGCLGLFGLATYAAQRRAKEVGIRKVLGASVFRIIGMMSGEFLVLVVIANAIAWPIGYFLMRKWLQEYAYRCSFGIEIFALAGLGTMMLALFVIGLQTVKAALANPLESIKYE